MEYSKQCNVNSKTEDAKSIPRSISTLALASATPLVSSDEYVSWFGSQGEYPSKWIELPTTGLFSVDLAAKRDLSDECSCRDVLHFPWESSLRPLANARLEGPPSPLDASEREILLQEAALTLKDLLAESVRRRIESIPHPQELKEKSEFKDARVGILFSGGVDCMVIAALCDSFLPDSEPIDLLNVCFSNSHQSPDRISAVDGVKELRKAFPRREWRLIRVDALYDTVIEMKDRVLQLCAPANTHMDFNIGSAFWCASKGLGIMQYVAPSLDEPSLFAPESSLENTLEVKPPDLKRKNKHERCICPQPKCGKVMKAGCGLGACKACCTSIHRLAQVRTNNIP